MITIDLPAGLAIGSAVAIYNHHHLAKKPSSEFYLRALILSLFGFTPLAHLFLLFFPDWEMQYFIDTRQLPTWFDALFVLAINALALLGCHLCLYWQRQNKLATAKRFLALTIAAIGAYFPLAYARVFFVGSHEEWINHAAPFMLTHVAYLTLLILTGSYLAVFLYFGLKMKTEVSGGSQI